MTKKKYFVITDVHSYYDEMIKALNKAGFDKNNPEHTLVHCGDLFDRGPKPKECLDYIMSIPKERRVLIMGNHEERLLQILDGWRCPDESDYHNKTMDTIIKFADAGTPKGYSQTKRRIDDAIYRCLQNQKLNEYLRECKDYYETEDFIFTHGWIPMQEFYRDWTRADDDQDTPDNSTYYRTARPQEWEKARWLCGFHEWFGMTLDHDRCNMKIPEKTIVVGHWHTSWAHSRYHGVGIEFASQGQSKNMCHFEPFIDTGIIGLDACTAYSGFCNCIVLEDNDL